MAEIDLKNSFMLLGNWVILSLLAGLIVATLLLLYRYLNPELTAKNKYFTALLSLCVLFILTFWFSYILPDISGIFSTKSGDEITENVLAERQLVNQLFEKSTGDTVSSPARSDESSYVNVIQIALGVLWLVGVFIYIIKFLGGYIYMKLLLKNASSIIPHHWQEKAIALRKQLKISSHVKLILSKKVNSPLTFGFLKPVIIFPVGFFTTLPPDQIEAIILHELYHIKNKDYLLNLLVISMEIIFFYHPLIWHLSKEIQAERENSCDDAVISQIKDPFTYAKALINVEEYRQNHLALSLHFSSKTSQLNNRIMRLFSKAPSKSFSIKPFLVLLCLTSFLMSFTLLSWKNNEASKVEKSVTSERVYFKVYNDYESFGIIVKEDVLIAKSKNEQHSFWLDDQRLGKNNYIDINHDQLVGILLTNNNKEYRIYSKEYLTQEGDQVFTARSDNDILYRFNTGDGSSVTTEFNNWKKPHSQKNQKSSKLEKRRTTDESTIYGPVTFSLNETKKEIANTDNILPGNLSSIKPQILTPDVENLTITSSKSMVQDTVKVIQKNTTQDKLKTDSLLIVLDGKILGIGSSHLSDLDPNKIGSINILKGKTALDKYGQKAAYGVLEVITGDGFTEEDLNMLVSSYGQNERDEEGPMEKFDTETQPLFYVDGVPTEKSYLKNIDPNDIKKINVLKDKKATKKYGQKAKNGVVEIFTKGGNE